MATPATTPEAPVEHECGGALAEVAMLGGRGGYVRLALLGVVPSSTELATSWRGVSRTGRPVGEGDCSADLVRRQRRVTFVRVKYSVGQLVWRWSLLVASSIHRTTPRVSRPEGGERNAASHFAPPRHVLPRPVPTRLALILRSTTPCPGIPATRVPGPNRSLCRRRRRGLRHRRA